ncbi:assimilatory sulfite reductase (NADPH) flavoprotein subunit [Parapusillimonas granuli]|uniref:Sulfite reductase [NADPH] flavoprotein alpha-component n=1 Tax=Parapusillimonas granuli TaxID=380911 RepID=A0A853G0D7_9BURK|nr:assimilatory sulfite reductase (NADPH) flavoprotein subunit [Parapusillimonas granuli]MBB5215033.1 sulfite reductase (NADPH) flavoprotein alpha-component [Parapusillimonas granuli]MEB2401721.1 assimilatory sulfite reductase (NADPH) flavoprotein subunit [Alcaligenaceae bacterium]NYT49352.1 assimilatory sulfite reductase (NADPH) flavoprotein subunit [Parapusillimonas granuli]
MPAPTYLPESKHHLVTELADGLESAALTWLSGYFAGVAQGRQLPRAEPALVPAAVDTSAQKRLTILYGSQTGNAKRVAESLAEQVAASGLDYRLVRADGYATRELKDEHLLYLVISTQGDGEAPDDSLAFVEFLNSRRAPKLPQLQYAVLGLGDSSYPLFCGIAQSIDARLAELGARRLQDTGTADLDIETIAGPWREQAVLQAREVLKKPAAKGASITPLHPKTGKVTRERPFAAELLLNQAITGRGGAKDVRHLELSLEGSHVRYQPGDALGVWPVQSPLLVDRIVSLLGLDADEAVEHQQATRPLREWLSRHRELTVLTRPFLTAHAERSGSGELQALLLPDAQESLKRLLANQQLADILESHPAPWTASELVAALRPISPRMYSIASSQAAVGEEVHLTLANVAYETATGPRWGAASNFLSNLREGERVDVFVEENTRFRLPSDPARDIIMIGPGTGIAPFRAFVQERSAAGATGRNWLFFGNPHFATDFLYQTEWQQALKSGRLHRLDVAFSRDQAEKVYVQHKLKERAAEVYAWIQGGAHVYVCGDANRMARDVQQALLDIAQQEGGMEAAQAKAWLDALAAQGRYARDVY